MNLYEINKDKMKYIDFLKENIDSNLYNVFIKGDRFYIIESLYFSYKNVNSTKCIDQSDFIFLEFLDSLSYFPENKKIFNEILKNNFELKKYLFDIFDKKIKLIYNNKYRLCNFIILFNDNIFQNKIKYKEYYNYLLLLIINNNILYLTNKILKYLNIQDKKYIKDIIIAKKYISN